MGIIFVKRKTKNKTMETNNFDNNLNTNRSSTTETDLNGSNYGYMQSPELSASMSRTFVANVFSWMAAALIITAIVAYYFAYDPQLFSLLVDTQLGKITAFGYFAIFSPVALSFLMPVAFSRFSYPVLLLFYLLFSCLMGVSLSFIFYIYTTSSIYTVFLSCAGMFGIMAIAGYTTKTDLTKFGTILFMGAMGVVISSVVNYFMDNDTFSYIIGVVGILVFTGLTAYQVQTLKELGATSSITSDSGKKYVLQGALGLYITFINLFISLLRVFGNRK
jgi:FtsH-binding integral membrane protein